MTMNRERIDLAKKIMRLCAQRQHELGRTSLAAELVPQIVADVMQTVVGLTREEFCAAAGEIQAEAQALTTLIDQVQALGDRLGVNPRLNVRDNVKRWADAGDTEAAELLASGVLDTKRRA